MERKKTGLLKAIYSRISIDLEGVRLRPNQGVAQGSVLSPALFDVYAEDLLYTIEKESGLSKDQILMYADDLLVICPDQVILKHVIEIIQEWSQKNSMILNKKNLV